MTYRTHPEDEERQREEHDARRERFERDLAARERIAEHGGVPVEDPAVERLARMGAETTRPVLRAIGGGGLGAIPTCRSRWRC